MNFSRTFMQVTVFLIIVAIGIVTIVFNLQDSSSKGLPSVGERVPSFELKGLDSQTYTLSNWKGQLLVLNFWGTFCPPCRNEMPALQNQSKKWNEKGVTIVGISVDKSKVTVENFVREYDISFPILLDYDEQVRIRYGVMNYPTTLFISPDGKVAYVQIGEMTESFIEEKISALISK